MLDRLLRAEGEGDAADAQTRDHGRHRVAEGGGGGHGAGQHHGHLEQVAADDEHRARRGVLGGPRPLHRQLDERVHRAPQRPEHGDDHGRAEQRLDRALRPGRQLEPRQAQLEDSRRPQRGERRRHARQPAFVEGARRAPEHPCEQAARERAEQPAEAERERARAPAAPPTATTAVRRAHSPGAGRAAGRPSSGPAWHRPAVPTGSTERSRASRSVV